MIMMTALCLQFIFSHTIVAQGIPARPIAQQVSNLKNSGLAIKPVSLFSINAARSAVLQPDIRKALAVTLDMNALATMKAANDEFITFSFPYDDRNITLELYKVNILTDDFTVVTDQSNGEAISYTPGIYYRGIVKGDENSLAALSFFDGEMMGVVSTEQYDNINIGKSQDASAKNYDYVIYSDKHLPAKESACATVDDPSYAPLLQQYAANGATLRTTNCVRIYYEMDNNLYINNGSSTTTATNWMTAVHNNVATLYSNDAVTASISQIYIWTTGDPYNGTTSSSQLSKFKSNRPTFNGDLGQLVGIDPGGLGGVASTINGMCSSTNKYCYSDVDFGYNTVPTYSWTIMVCTHELGHLFSSRHTHACVWNGNNTAIDGCAGGVEGSCALPGYPSGGGTIMSYCHLQSVGINFNNGFGPQPGDKIRTGVANAGCLSANCTPFAGNSGSRTGDGTLATDARINLTPNPASDKVLVDLRVTLNDGEKGVLRLFNAQGRLVYTTTFTNENTAFYLQTGQFTAGLYFVDVQTAAEKLTSSLVLN